MDMSYPGVVGGQAKFNFIFFRKFGLVEMIINPPEVFCSSSNIQTQAMTIC